MQERIEKLIRYTHTTFPKGCSVHNESDLYLEDGSIRQIEDYEIEYILDKLKDDFLFGEDNAINICGCGNPKITTNLIQNALKSKNIDDYREREKFISSLFGVEDYSKNTGIYGAYQFMLYILDDKEFTEHGGSIGGAWLTEKGKMFLEICEWLDEFNTKENNL